MSNLIQIKRSTTTAAAPTLANGELAFTANGNVLFIGSNGSTVSIGGERTPGTLTANQALVANSTGYLDVIKTANLYIGVSSVNQINAVGNSTFLGTGANNELVTSYAIKQYIDLRTGANAYPQGANGAFQYNNSGALFGTNNFFYDNSTGVITVGNSSVNVQMGYIAGNTQMAHFHGNANTYVQSRFVNANTGNAASVDVIWENDVANDTFGYLDIGINGSNYDQSAYDINGAGDAYIYAQSGAIALGTASAKPVQFFANGTTSTNEVMRITAGANVGIGNTAPNAKLQVTGTANISGAVALGGVTTVSGNIVFNSAAGIVANGSIGTAGQTLLSNGTSVYWGTGTSGTNTQIQFNDSGVANASAGFTFDKSTNTLFVANTIDVGTSQFHANTLGLYIGNVSSVATLTTNSQYLVRDLTSETGNSFSQSITTSYIRNQKSISGGTRDVAQLDRSQIYIVAGENALTPTTYDTKLFANTTYISVGNSSVNSISNTAGVFTTGTVNGAVVGVGTSSFANGSGVFTTGTVNGAVISVGSYFQANATLTNAVAFSTGANFIANSTGAYANVVSANSIQINGTVGANASGVYTSGIVNAATFQVGSDFTANSSMVTFAGANIDATNATLRVHDVDVAGNLTVSGTLTAINTNTLEVKDNMIKLADNQANSGTFTDAVSTGWYMTYGNTANVQFAGMFRDENSSSPSFSVFRLFHTDTEPTTTVNTTDPTYVPGALLSWIFTPKSTLVANSSVLTIQPNTGINVTISANTLTLTQALAGNSGGTGLNSYTAEDILVANSTNGFRKLGLGTSGYVLQSNGTALVYDVLDGGSF